MRAVMAALLGCATLAGITSCALPPANWSDDLNRIRTVAVLKTPPPGGVEVASAEYEGSTELGSAHDPGIAKIFATDQSIQQVVSNYEHAYPEYRLSAEPIASSTEAVLDGNADPTWMNIRIEIVANQPNLISSDYDLKPTHAPPGHNTSSAANRAESGQRCRVRP